MQIPLLERRKARPTRSLTAAASRVKASENNKLRRLVQPWQHTAMAFYETLGEINFAGQFYARTLSKVRYFAAELDENGDPQESKNADLRDLWDRVQDPGGGRTNIFTAYGQLRFLCGECYLVCSGDSEAPEGETWEILSVAELRATDNGRYQRITAPGLGYQELVSAPDDEFQPLEGEVAVYRLYRPDPRFRKLADAPMRGVLTLCEELVLLDLAVRARARSRAAGPGILLISDALTLPSADGGEQDRDLLADPVFGPMIQSIMSPLSDPGSAAAVVPHIMTVPAEIDIEKVMRLIKLNDPAEQYQEQQTRSETVKRIATGLDFPIEYMLGMTDANHWCVDDQTEILTRDRGWITQDELAIGDTVRTLNHDTGLAEWQPVMDIYRADVVDEPMRRLDARTHSSLTTLNHRWPVIRLRQKDGQQYLSREWTTTADLGVDDSIITGAFSGDQPDATHADDLVELAAWFWTEGHIRGLKNPSLTNRSISIAQSHTRNPQRVDRIRGCLTRMFGPPLESVRSLDTPAWREAIQPNQNSHGGPITVFNLNWQASAVILEAAPDKRLDPEFLCSLTRAQLDLFIDVSCQGDGHHYAIGELDLWQRDPEALDGYELAVGLSGRASSRQPSHEGGTVVRALRTISVRPVKASAQAARGGGGTAIDEIVAYTGVVWCPTTENHTWLARRDDRSFFTGNSGWLVDEQSWKAHLMPVVQGACDDFASAYLRPAAKAAEIANWQRVTVGYDAAEVINHPDKAKDAFQAYDRRAVGKVYLRSAIGAEDADAMPQDELNEALGVATRDSSLAVYGIPSIKAGGIEPEPGVVENPSGTQSEPTGPSTGADVEAGPPASAPEPRTASLTAVPFDTARILGIAEAQLERAREVAGNRIRNRSKGCADCQERLEGQPWSLTAAILGVEQARALLGDVTERDLVAGTAASFTRSAARVGIDPVWAAELGDLVEAHAARTLYEAEPPQMPAAFAALAARALTQPATAAA